MKQQQQQQPSLPTLFMIKSTFVHAFSIQRIWNVPKRHQQQQSPPKKHRFRSSMDHDEISKTTTSTPTTTSLHDASSIHPNNQNSNNNNSNIQFLGKGVDAMVRLGVVLVAPQNEFHHFYRQAAIYIYAMGYDNDIPNNDTGSSSSSTYYIRGVIVDHPTPFTVQEMIPSLAATTNPQQQQQHPLASNLIFRGGDRGRENSVLLLHNQKNIPGCSDEIGTSGLYHGGFDYLVSSSSDRTNHHTNENDMIDMDGNNFKFFFNYCEFTEDELEELFASNEDGDAWASVQIHDPSILLNEEWDRGDCWRYIRNGIVSQMKVSE